MRLGWILLCLAGCTFGSAGGGGDAGGDGSTSTTGGDGAATTAVDTTSSPDDTTSSTTLPPTTTSTPTCPDDWHGTAWTHRARVTIDNQGGGSRAQQIPLALPIDLSDPALAAAAPDGADLWFVTDDGTMVLHEIEHVAGEDRLVAWLRVPEVTGDNTPQGLWMYFGEGTGSNLANPVGTWDGYAAVWHLTSPDGSLYLDEHGIANGIADGASSTAGRLGGGAGFSGTTETIDFGEPSQPLMDGWGEFSVSMWVRVDYPDDPTWESVQGAIIGRGGGMMAGRTWRQGDSPPGFGFVQIDFILDGPDNLYHRFELEGQKWHWIVYDWDGDRLRMYLDGESYADRDAADAPLVSTSDATFLGGNQSLVGVLDEVRISDVSRPESWYRLQYGAMIGDLLYVGNVQACPD